MQTRNRSFGGVRNPNVSVIDISGRRQGMPGYASSGYAMASGTTQASLTQARAELKTLQEERLSLANTLQSKVAAINANELKYKQGSDGWHACKSTDCAWNHSASRCDGCRAPHADAMKAAENARPALVSARTAAAGNLAQKDSEIDQVEATIAGLLASIEAENQAEQTLAGQGMTSEAIAAEAQAKAKAEVETARITAEASASGTKTRNMVIALVAVAVVAVGVIFMIRKIRKKRKGKK